jgi:hypothetical protein
LAGGGRLEAGIFRTVVRRFLRRPAVAAHTVEEPALTNTAHVAEHGLLAPADAKNALSNLKGDSAVTVRDFGQGSGFSGVYNHDTGKFLAYPSGDTVLRSGDTPANRVERYGGHYDVNQVLSRTLDVDPSTNVGFAAVMKDDGSFGFRWTSRSVNGLNPSFEGVQVPEHMRGPIMDAFTRATGRAARSDV